MESIDLILSNLYLDKYPKIDFISIEELQYFNGMVRFLKERNCSKLDVLKMTKPLHTSRNIEFALHTSRNIEFAFNILH